jgi:hypothetical protein
VSDALCIPRAQLRLARVRSVSGQERRLRDRFVPALVPARQPAGPASAMFRAV